MSLRIVGWIVTITGRLPQDTDLVDAVKLVARRIRPRSGSGPGRYCD